MLTPRVKACDKYTPSPKRHSYFGVHHCTNHRRLGKRMHSTCTPYVLKYPTQIQSCLNLERAGKTRHTQTEKSRVGSSPRLLRSRFADCQECSIVCENEPSLTPVHRAENAETIITFTINTTTGFTKDHQIHHLVHDF